MEQEKRMKSMGFSERHFTKSKLYGPLIKQLHAHSTSPTFLKPVMKESSTQTEFEEEDDISAIKPE